MVPKDVAGVLDKMSPPVLRVWMVAFCLGILAQLLAEEEPTAGELLLSEAAGRPPGQQEARGSHGEARMADEDEQSDAEGDGPSLFDHPARCVSCNGMHKRGWLRLPAEQFICALCGLRYPHLARDHENCALIPDVWKSAVSRDSGLGEKLEVALSSRLEDAPPRSTGTGAGSVADLLTAEATHGLMLRPELQDQVLRELSEVWNQLPAGEEHRGEREQKEMEKRVRREMMRAVSELTSVGTGGARRTLMLTMGEEDATERTDRAFWREKLQERYGP